MSIKGAIRVLLLGVVTALWTLPARAGLNTSDWRFYRLWEDSDVSTWRLPPAIWLEAHGEICTQVLALTPDQVESLWGIVEGAEKEFMYTWLERKETLIDAELEDEINPPDDDRGRDRWRERWKMMSAIQEELHGLRQKLAARILTDLRLVVTSEQSDKWPELERAMRRSFSLLHLANLRLEGLDLDALVRAMDPSAEVVAKVEPILAQYLIDLDPLIVARDQAAAALLREAQEAREINDEIEEARSNGEEVDRRMASKSERAGASVVRAASSVLDASKRIADLNATTLTQIQEFLPPEMSAEIEKIATSPLFTRRNNYWSQSQAHAALHLAENLSTFSESLASENLWWGSAGAQMGVNRIRSAVKPLTEEQMAKIKEIRAKFEAEDRIIKGRMEPDEDADPSRSSWISVRVQTGSVGISRVEELEQMSEKRRKREQEASKKQAELVLETLKEVREVLDPEQRMLIAAFMW